MEIYDGPYFFINKRLLQNAGLWPYEKSSAKKLASRLYLGLSIFTLTLPQFYGLYKNFGVRVDRTIEHMALLMYMNIIFLKLIISILAETNLKKVYDSVAENWTNLTDPCERRISITGRWNDIHLPGFIFNGEFPVENMRDHYLEIFVFDVLGCLNTVYVLVTVDSMYACYIEHCIGLFAIIKHRLKLCTDRTVDDDGRDVAYEMIVEIVKLHRKIIAFTDLLEQSYSRSFLVLMGLNMLYCSFVCTLLLIKLKEVTELIRYIAILGGLVIHLFYVSWPGQKLIEHSAGLFDDAYTNEWYKISRESKRLLQIMRSRCLKPCKLTAGTIYIMNLANFALIIKVSGSYITIFSSLARESV